MRCFIALLPRREDSILLARAAKEISLQHSSGRPCAARNIHLTLAFLGEIRAEQALCINKALFPMQESSPIEWTLSRWGIFGNVLWAAGNSSCDILQRATLVRSALNKCGVSFDKKAFRAHISLVRSWSQPCPLWTGNAVTIHLSAPVLMQSLRDAEGRLIYRRVE